MGTSWILITIGDGLRFFPSRSVTILGDPGPRGLRGIDPICELVEPYGMLVFRLFGLADKGCRLAVVCGGGRGIAADLVDMTEALDSVNRIGEAV